MQVRRTDHHKFIIFFTLVTHSVTCTTIHSDTLYSVEGRKGHNYVYNSSIYIFVFIIFVTFIIPISSLSFYHSNIRHNNYNFTIPFFFFFFFHVLLQHFTVLTLPILYFHFNFIILNLLFLFFLYNFTILILDSPF